MGQAETGQRSSPGAPAQPTAALDPRARTAAPGTAAQRLDRAGNRSGKGGTGTHQARQGPGPRVTQTGARRRTTKGEYQ